MNKGMYTICDVCGCKIRAVDAVIIRDKYNHLNNRVVCKNDVDKTNPQVRPSYVRERVLINPELVRNDYTDRYVSETLSTRVPSAPRNLRATLSGISDVIALYWDGPENPGDSPVIGYRITRAWPQVATQEVIKSNTNSYNMYYEDTEGNINLFYTYQVAAINSAGVSAYSNLAYYPSLEDTTGVDYILASDTGYFLVTSDTGLLIEQSE